MKQISVFRLGLLPLIAIALVGCSTGEPPPPPPHADNDPAGLGTPQERLKALQENTSMPPQLKERKIKILQSEIDGTAPGPGGKH